MYKYLLLLIVSVPCFSQTPAKGFRLQENEYFNAPARREFQQHLKGVKIYNIDYIAPDSVAVKGFLLMPEKAGAKYPVVIYNRGGNGSYGMVTEPYIMMFLSKIAARGFIVIGSQLRGSEGSGGADEFGGKDVDDVIVLFSLIDKLDNADTLKVAQIGWSRGGVTNFQVLKKTSRIVTTINIAGPADLMKSREKMFDVYHRRIPGYSKDSVAALKGRSPVFQADSVLNKKASFLFVHGDADVHVDVADSKELYAKMQQLGYRSELLVYPGADHSIKAAWPDLIHKITAWLNKEFRP
jgi:dipeptidyl aminopeptidase/acylaminoacyl peptidase